MDAITVAHVGDIQMIDSTSVSPISRPRRQEAIPSSSHVSCGAVGPFFSLWEKRNPSDNRP